MSAHRFALANDVWAEDPAVDIESDIRFYSDDPDAFPAECSPDDCIRVDSAGGQRAVVGYLVVKPDLTAPDGGSVSSEASFVKAIRVVR